MKKYFYADGTKSLGPFTIEELKEKNITRETKVWYQGLEDWHPAGTLQELGDIFKLMPPSVMKEGAGNKFVGATTQQPPKTWLVESILVTLFCCLPFGVVGIINAARVESRFYAGDIDGAIIASNEAKKWTKIGFWLGIAAVVIYFVLTLFTVGTGVFM